MMNGVNPTVKYLIRSLSGLIVLIVGSYALLANKPITEELAALLVIVYGFQQSIDGTFTVRQIRNGKDE